MTKSAMDALNEMLDEFDKEDVELARKLDQKKHRGLVFVLSWLGSFSLGYVLMCGWNWFVSPLVNNVTLNYAHAYALVWLWIGVSSTAQLTPHMVMLHEQTTATQRISTAAVKLLYPFWILLILWLIHTYLY